MFKTDAITVTDAITDTTVLRNAHEYAHECGGVLEYQRQTVLLHTGVPWLHTMVLEYSSTRVAKGWKGGRVEGRHGTGTHGTGTHGTEMQ